MGTKLLTYIGWLFKSVGLISKNDYENFKFNLPLIENCEVVK